MRAKCIAASLVLLFLASGICTADTTYSGSLSRNANEITATSSWSTTDPPDLTISWTVSENLDYSWHYEYTLITPSPDISHLVIEVTEGAPSADFFNISWSAEDVEIGTASAGPGNPNMPEDVYGIKFDDVTTTSLTVSFDSWRVPVWGDFYAKCGGQVNTAWNDGFTSSDWDPLVAIHDGSEQEHLLVPDSRIPEPGTIALFGLGLLGLGARLRRRKQS